MKTTIFILLIASYFPINAQVQELVLPASSGSVVYSDSTENGAEYLITVEGIYSMWPQFNSSNEFGCVGADAAYIYNVPKEEMDAFRWPPDIINLPVIGKKAFVPLPHWVGDNTEYSLPPKELGSPLFIMSFRKNTGFRIDGEPLPNSGFDKITHRYQITKVANGDPFAFEILDSAYNVIQERTLARYEDNCGELIIKIHKVQEEGINICNIEPVCEDGVYVGLKLNASVFEKDTTLVEGKRNLLHELEYDQISIVDNGRFICNIYSINCIDESESISVGIVMDRSGSMGGPISESDPTQRLSAAKKSVKEFIDQLRDRDSTFLISFASFSSLDQDWTNDKDLLKSKVDILSSNGGTKFYGSVFEGLDKLKLSYNPNRFLVVLSDGGNTVWPDWKESYIDQIRDINIPVYFIALGFSNETLDVVSLERMYRLAQACNGKVFDVRDSEELSLVYNNIITEELMSDCCAIYFPIDDCIKGEEKVIRLLFAPGGTKLYSEYISFACGVCDDEETTTNIDLNIDEDVINVYPNPVQDQCNIQVSTKSNTHVKLSLLSIDGNKIRDLHNGYSTGILFMKEFDSSYLSSGIYLIQLEMNGDKFHRKLIKMN